MQVACDALPTGMGLLMMWLPGWEHVRSLPGLLPPLPHFLSSSPSHHKLPQCCCDANSIWMMWPAKARLPDNSSTLSPCKIPVGLTILFSIIAKTAINIQFDHQEFCHLGFLGSASLMGGGGACGAYVLGQERVHYPSGLYRLLVSLLISSPR